MFDFFYYFIGNKKTRARKNARSAHKIACILVLINVMGID